MALTILSLAVVVQYLERFMKYVFFDGKEPGIVNVSAGTLYGKSNASEMSGSEFGFITERNRNADADLKIPEITSGFLPAQVFGGGEITDVCQDAQGSFVSSKYDGVYPLSFRVDVNGEGVYSVSVKVFAATDIENLMIFSNNRQLVFRGALKKGCAVEKTFPVVICPIIPRNYTEAAATKGITVTVLGNGARLQSIETQKTSRRTIWIAGDSTVTNQCCEYPYVSGASYAGWGQMLQLFVGDALAVSNHAHSGLTLESFRSEGHYEILRNRVRKNDVVLFQFGHNDQKLAHLTADGGYRKLYEAYIAEIRALGGIPVIVTPLARNSWKGDGESYNDLLSAYNDSCVRLGKDFDVPVVALHDAAVDFIVRNGRDAVKKYFFPSDYTHTNDYGAFFFAGVVYSELVRLGVIAAESSASVEKSDPSLGGANSADALTDARLPDTREPAWVAPEKMEMPDLPKELAAQGASVAAGAAGEDPFAAETCLDKELSRAESLELVIKAMKFFPTNVYNDIFTDVVGHETYAGAVECAVQNGIIPERDIASKRFRPTDHVTGDEFLEFAANGYRSRQPGNVDEVPAAEKLKKKDVVLKKEALELLRALKV